MSVIDKIQGTFEKLTHDDTRLNAAEITTLQQAHHAMQLGIIKIEAYLPNVQSADLRHTLQSIRDDVLKSNVDRPKRILEKSGIPYLNLNVDERVNVLRSVSGTPPARLLESEILLDTVLTLQTTIMGLQAGALAAVRGDVRDFFLTTRDAAFDEWRKVGAVAYATIPQAIPPTMSGIAPR